MQGALLIFVWCLRRIPVYTLKGTVALVTTNNSFFPQKVSLPHPFSPLDTPMPFKNTDRPDPVCTSSLEFKIKGQMASHTFRYSLSNTHTHTCKTYKQACTGNGKSDQHRKCGIGPMWTEHGSSTVSVDVIGRV